MFIEPYRLETNPFAQDGIRPLFMSQSMRYAQLKLVDLLAGRIQTLFLSGAAGVGKSTLVGQQLRGLKGVGVSWIKPGMTQPEQLLAKLVRDIGPGEVAGSLGELKNILEVFLKHQAANGRLSLVVVDALERLALPMIRELESLCRIRVKNRPIVRCIFVTRSEDLVASLMAEQEASRATPTVHQRLAGFTLEETTAYIRACLHGAGCSWVEELVPDDAVVDVLGFTQGVVGDVNALCREALEAVAAQKSADYRQLRVTRVLLKDAGQRLHLRYDAAVWQQRASEPPSAEAILVSDPNELRIDAARLLVTSAGESLAEIALERPRLVLGRDDACDIRLDGSYVSRYQNLFMETPGGWLLIDLNSTNGSFVNGRRVREHRLRDGDLIAIGQYQLRFSADAAAQTGQPSETSADETAVSVKPAIGKLA
ncbi:MAG TPA: FHA domain-containing protein [Gammaproteobacteria bacterium]|nr:FHA domain-containing protein [Gammaproteobacteria bacterium]